MKELAFVFDLDRTIGYFFEAAIVRHSFQLKLKRNLKQKECFEIFDAMPEIFRPGILTLFKYLIKLKKEQNTKIKILLYTNNQGPKNWVPTIIKYIEHKLKYKLFDRVILAWKIKNKVVEKCRNSDEKTYKDIIKCGKLKLDTEIFFFDDQRHTGMFDQKINYIFVENYRHDIILEELAKRLIKTKIGKLVSKKTNNNLKDFEKYIINFSKNKPLGYSFKYIEETYNPEKFAGEDLIKEIDYYLKKDKIYVDKNEISMNLSRGGLESPNAPARTTSHVRGGTKSHHTKSRHTKSHSTKSRSTKSHHTKSRGTKSRHTKSHRTKSHHTRKNK